MHVSQGRREKKYETDRRTEIERERNIIFKVCVTLLYCIRDAIKNVIFKLCHACFQKNSGQTWHSRWQHHQQQTDGAAYELTNAHFSRILVCIQK